jgi:hypothetical protein
MGIRMGSNISSAIGLKIYALRTKRKLKKPLISDVKRDEHFKIPLMPLGYGLKDAERKNLD